MENSVVINVKGNQIVSAPVKFADDAELWVEVSKADLFEDLDLQAVPISNKQELFRGLLKEMALEYLKGKCEQSEYGRELFDEMELSDEFQKDLDKLLSNEWKITQLGFIEDDLDNLFDNYKDTLLVKYYAVSAEVTMTAPVTIYVKARSRVDAEDFVRDMNEYDLNDNISDWDIQDIGDINADEQSYDEYNNHYYKA